MDLKLCGKWPVALPSFYICEKPSAHFNSHEAIYKRFEDRDKRKKIQSESCSRIVNEEFLMVSSSGPNISNDFGNRNHIT